ncbi:MAG: VWA domain-containing protein [Verrucomicrobiota bacterium]
MPVTFANLAGFWALLGIPAILLIHFLQRQSEQVPISTRFLLERIDRQSLSGRKFDRIRSSIPLWLQLLSVLLLTWLLVQPRWSSPTRVQRVVVVLDSSASMAAFRTEIQEAFENQLTPLTTFTGTSEFTLIESHLEGSTLYRGTSLEELTRAIEVWEPNRGAHSPEAALRVGRGLAGPEGVLVYVSDHVGDTLPFDAALLAIGSPIDNVGFAGVSIDSEQSPPVWRASIRNYSTEAQTRSWTLTTESGRAPDRALALEAGEIRTLEGPFPENAERVSLSLESDQFGLDDTLPLVLPQPKRLVVSKRAPERLDRLILDLTESLENAPYADEGAIPDLIFAGYDPLSPTELPAVAIVLLSQQSVPRQFLSGPILGGNHPLVDGLNWQALIARRTPSIPAQDGDIPLLWQGEKTLISLRESNTPEGVSRQLLFHFDILRSNASNLPAFVILIHRFIDRVRQTQIGEEHRNVEINQDLNLFYENVADSADLTLSTPAGRETVPIDRARLLNAPASPGFFAISQGDQPLLLAAAHFADTREADLSEAATRSDLARLPGEILEQQTRPDPYAPIWILLLGLLGLASWWFLNREKPLETNPAEPDSNASIQSTGS